VREAPCSDPFDQFDRWFADAVAGEPSLPEAMALSTVDHDGMPAARMVLLKAHDRSGFTFYTNLGSAKAKELAGNPKASLLFHWKSRRRQVRIAGDVERVPDRAADEYFASRPRKSRIGAWASRQSEVLEGRFELERRVAEFTAKYAVGPIPRPPFWGGYTVRPRSFEFWEDRRFRLHVRFRHMRTEGGWVRTELYP